MSPMPKKNKERLESAGVKPAVKRLLDKHRWFWWMPPSNQFSKTGISDIHSFRNRVFMVIETKRGKSGLAATQPTANQIAFLQSIRDQQGFAFLVYEDRIEHLAAFLGAFDRSIAAVQAGQKVADEDGAMMLNAIKEMQKEF